ncbi:DUF1134 domain-containing protein [Amorphus orientalis]|uniref:DUF1134 domain-containing protein n=1 Tax=Amorphus orientalis TaxID=649198 RepID=A0AAE3VKY9_9HYPH|nr:DUF1134 domain-containing protein [Amorphus orientalis]MDQ0313937.1 hypothetical protein [Amorphus orientalis]
MISEIVRTCRRASVRLALAAVLSGTGALGAAHAQQDLTPAPSYQQGAPAQTGQPQSNSYGAVGSDEYSPEEIAQAGHQFFGEVSGGLATIIERAFSSYGPPNGYILGEEASGALVGGLRYGEGTLYTRGTQTKVYWQGPSLGWDFGGDGARVMTLVYDLPSVEAIFQRYVGVNGSAYLVGGFGMTLLAADTTYIIPVRSGVGARLGINLGYLKFTRRPTWNPF